MIKRRRLTEEERIKLYTMFDGHCAYCGVRIKFIEMQADHKVPISIGGSDTIDNMYPACRSCNHYKHSLTIEKFRSALNRMPAVLARDNVTYQIATRFGLVCNVRKKVQFYFETFKY